MRAGFFIGLFIISSLSCTKDGLDRIPEAYVNYRITIQEFNIKNKNGLLLVNKMDNTGVAGLIIYRRSDNAYVAFDRCSSVNPQSRCAVVPDDPNLTATDPCSGAKFSLFDGSAVKAPAKRPLKEYKVIISNFEISVVN
jgi:nitrite reductase/ring-hydroxylating ferredoxin subunit